MSILSDSEIIKAVEKGEIFISDFNPKREYNEDGSYTGKLNPNGYNLSLNNKLLVYENFPLDMKSKNEVKEIIIPEEGYLLEPGKLYLGKTNEYTKTSEKYCPFLEGRSSTGRLGMSIHVTAGAGDAGFCGNWTLEITVVHPLIVYPNAEICQIMYHDITGKVLNPYRGKYFDSKDVLPSKMYMDENLSEKKEEKSKEDNRIAMSDMINMLLNLSYETQIKIISAMMSKLVGQHMIINNTTDPSNWLLKITDGLQFYTGYKGYNENNVDEHYIVITHETDSLYMTTKYKLFIEQLCYLYSKKYGHLREYYDIDSGKIVSKSDSSSIDELKAKLSELLLKTNKMIEITELLSSSKMTINLSNQLWTINVMRTKYSNTVISFSKFGQFYLFDYNEVIEKLEAE